MTLRTIAGHNFAQVLVIFYPAIAIATAHSARTLLETSGLKPTPRRVALSGIADKVSVYEIS